MSTKNIHIDPRQAARVKELRDVQPGTVFRLPGNRVKWRKLPGKAVKCGWLWLYWCTDGRIRKKMWGGKTTFIEKQVTRN